MATDELDAAAGGELDAKLGLIRAELAAHDLGAIRLRGSDWFAWLTCGGCSVVDSSAEVGVAELLVDADEAIVLANRIDAQRLRVEEVPPQLPVIELPWTDPDRLEAAVLARVRPGSHIASDRPRANELPLPSSLATARPRMMAPEIERFRGVGRDAAVAVGAALRAARPQRTEGQLAADTAAALIDRGLWPVVLLVGGERRLRSYRHPTPRSDELIGDRAMVVVCARRHGLIANLTRFVSFRAATAGELAAERVVAQIEAAAFDASTPGSKLGDVYRVIADAYVRAGSAGADADHHQGGLAGYRSREEIATPASTTLICEGSALAWNPSLPGSKVEDTAVVGRDGLEILTVDPDWPTKLVNGRLRPDVLVLA